MYRVTQITTKQKEDEPECDKENAYNKAPDQNVGKDFQPAYETRRLIHFLLLSGFSAVHLGRAALQQFILCVI
jgi:hypothetical protein